MAEGRYVVLERMEGPVKMYSVATREYRVVVPDIVDRVDAYVACERMNREAEREEARDG